MLRFHLQISRITLSIYPLRSVDIREDFIGYISLILLRDFLLYMATEYVQNKIYNNPLNFTPNFMPLIASTAINLNYPCRPRIHTLIQHITSHTLHHNNNNIYTIDLNCTALRIAYKHVLFSLVDASLHRE